jgi:hypothetical protein
MNRLLIIPRIAATRPVTVVLMALAAVSMAVITLFEATDPAREVPYRLYLSPFFTGLLFLVWINLFCNAARRTWWRRSKIPSILAHVGFLLILTGGFFTWTLGIRGNLMIGEGDTSHTFFNDDPVLRVTTDGAEEAKEIAFPLIGGGTFRNDSILGALNPFNRLTATLPESDLAVSILDFLPSSRRERKIVAAKEGKGRPAVTLSIAPVNRDGPISLQDGDRMKFPQGGPLSRVTYLHVADGEDPAALAKAEFGEWIEIKPPEKKPILLPLDVTKALGKEITGDGYTVRILEYHPDFKVGRTPSPADLPRNPAVKLHVEGPCGEKEMYAFARIDFHGNKFPDGTTVNYLRPAEGNALLILSRGNQVEAWRNGSEDPTPLKADSPVGLGEGESGVDVELAAFFPASRFLENIVPDEKEEGPPAFLVRMGDGGEPAWLSPEGGKAVSADGGAAAWVSHSMPLGFNITLNDAVAEFWPASSIAKAYYSLVSVADPGDRETRAERIETNAPLLHKGFRLYQSGMDQTPPYRNSTLAVARDPGLPLVATGFVVMMGGLLWLYVIRFILQPARRRGNGREVSS